MLMLLSVHVTGILFLVWFNNFAWASIGVTRFYSSHPFLYALDLHLRQNTTFWSKVGETGVGEWELAKRE